MPPLELSIPSTSTADDSTKPYTLYHIHLPLPLRTHIVKKRYSDFVKLDQALKSETTLSAPSQLPPKSWLKSTFSSEALVKDRQVALERYLLDILKDTNNVWRSSVAWKTFLELPTSYQPASDASTAQSLRSPTSASSANILTPSEWLNKHREAKTQLHSARSSLKNRDQATNTKEQLTLSTEAKTSLVRAATIVAQCDEALTQASNEASSQDTQKRKSSNTLAPGELRRRKDMLSTIRIEIETLQRMMTSKRLNTAVSPHSANNTPTSSTPDALSATTTTPSAQSAALFAGAPSRDALAQQSQSRRVLGGGGAPLKETPQTRERDNLALLQLQQDTMAQQEQSVLELGQAVARMKDMGVMINEELVVQNEMLGVVESDVERVQGKVDVAKKRIAKIS